MTMAEVAGARRCGGGRCEAVYKRAEQSLGWLLMAAGSAGAILQVFFLDLQRMSDLSKYSLYFVYLGLVVCASPYLGGYLEAVLRQDARTGDVVLSVSSDTLLIGDKAIAQVRTVCSYSEAIQNALKLLRDIAHGLLTLRRVDMIAVIQRGQVVVAKGSSGAYAALIRFQVLDIPKVILGRCLTAVKSEGTAQSEILERVYLILRNIITWRMAIVILVILHPLTLAQAMAATDTGFVGHDPASFDMKGLEIAGVIIVAVIIFVAILVLLYKLYRFTALEIALRRRQLPFVRYPPKGAAYPAGDVHTLCVVCISDYRTRDHIAVLLGCGHIFHRRCLRKEVAREYPRCPLCRAAIP